MIASVIAWCAGNRLATVLLVALAAGWGVVSVRGTALDAIPDLSDVQVIVYSEWMGRAPDLVEDHVTYPIVSSLLGSPRVTAVRGQSMFGMSFVNVIFEDGTDLYWARSRVLEKLSSISSRMPLGVTPVLGPDATGVGWVFEYAVIDRTGHTTLQQLQSLQDWTLRYALQAVPGVAEVASVGGFVKEYQVDVDPLRLSALGIPLATVVNAVRASNADVGGRVLEISGTEHYVRGRGYVKSPKDLENVVLGSHLGTPVLLREVASVRVGPAQRRGLADLDGEGETVGGVVVARSGTNALEVIDAVKARIAELQPGLPQGVQIVPTYDRSTLIRASIDTLRRTLIEELIVVTLVRDVLQPRLVGRLDGQVAGHVVERGGHGQDDRLVLQALGVGPAGGVVPGVNEMFEVAGRGVQGRAARYVGRPIFFSLLVITVGFLPVFTLEGTEGRLFSPLAWTKTFSMAFAAVLSVTLVPAIAATFIRGRIRGEERNPISRGLARLYGPVCRFALRFRGPVIAAALLLVLATIPVVSKLGGEFMPPLNEGTLLYMPTSVPGMSDATARDVLQRQDQMLR